MSQNLLNATHSKILCVASMDVVVGVAPVRKSDEKAIKEMFNRHIVDGV